MFAKGLILYSLLIASIALIVTFVVINKKNNEKQEKRNIIKQFFKVFTGNVEEFLFILFVSFSLTFISLFLLVTSETTTETNIYQKIESEYDKELVNLSYSDSISGNVNGSFFLGIGSITGDFKSEPYYYFYIKNEDRYKLIKIPASDVDIIETNETPKMKYTEKRLVKEVKDTTGKISKFFGFNLDYEGERQFSTKEFNKYGNPSMSCDSEILLYIPKGSITNDFNPNVN